MLSGRVDSQRGFSAIELAIVVAIIGLIYAIAAPSFRSFLIAMQIRGTTDALNNGIQLARTEALRRNATVRFSLVRSGSVYTKAWEVRTDTGTLVQSHSASESSGEPTLTVVPDGAITLTFNGLGRRVANADASSPVRAITIDVPSTVMSSASSPDLRIVTLSGGLVRMCDPNVSSASDPRYCPCDPAITSTGDARYCS